MTNTLVGDIYAKIIEEVVIASTSDFEESGISQGTLQALQQEWQAKLSQRNVAQMPWDPKPVQQSPAPPPIAPINATNTANGLPPSSYAGYDATTANNTASNGTRIKTEPGSEPQYPGAIPNGFPQSAPQPQGGIARAQQLVQAQYGQAASASLNAMQRGGLALPGQQQPPAKQQGPQLPQQTPQPGQATANRQPPQSHIKSENDSPDLSQGAFQQPSIPAYSQTDGADDSLEQWKAMLAERRAVGQEQRQHADRMMHEHVLRLSADLESGLMMPLDERQLSKGRRRKTVHAAQSESGPSTAGPLIPQLDGDVDDDEKEDLKDEDDEDAINSDLDDSESDGKGAMGEDEDEFGDEILCTYDKVQRVKNKWKCTLKDGVMAAGGRDWVFHKGMGEFEW